MTYFTSEELRPSEQTLNIIRQFAYTYRPATAEHCEWNGLWGGQNTAYCLN
ncbi:MAG: hypothetical protein IJM81_07410 [Prevotella sp.]|nr:hypothetical protein [Prevotella sp.]